MWGTSSPGDKLTGDFGNEPDTTLISDRGLFRLLAKNLSPGVFRLLQHGVISGSCHMKAQGISSPGTYEAMLMWPRNGGELRWSIMLDWTCR
jgi:hypothetical protein